MYDCHDDDDDDAIGDSALGGLCLVPFSEWGGGFVVFLLRGKARGEEEPVRLVAFVYALGGETGIGCEGLAVLGGQDRGYAGGGRRDVRADSGPAS